MRPRETCSWKGGSRKTETLPLQPQGPWRLGRHGACCLRHSTTWQHYRTALTHLVVQGPLLGQQCRRATRGGHLHFHDFVAAMLPLAWGGAHRAAGGGGQVGATSPQVTLAGAGLAASEKQRNAGPEGAPAMGSCLRSSQRPKVMPQHPQPTWPPCVFRLAAPQPRRSGLSPGRCVKGTALLTQRGPKDSTAPCPLTHVVEVLPEGLHPALGLSARISLQRVCHFLASVAVGD